jgi:hypothetical protein
MPDDTTTPPQPTREDVLDWLENQGRSALEVPYVLSAATAVMLVVAGIWCHLP